MAQFSTIKPLLYFFIFCILFSCGKNSDSLPKSDIAVIPYPDSIALTSGFFSSPDFICQDHAFLNPFKDILASWFQKCSVGPQPNVLFSEDKSLPLEGYKMDISTETIAIRSSSSKGAFYALQTLRQLNEMYHQRIPCMSVIDQPRFEYRGMHLDVCRHFFKPDFIKKYIDLLAMYKFNTFHWHLTDDQGWRIEIKKYPKLQEVASLRAETLIGHAGEGKETFDGKPHGGFYSQEEVREIVRYAQQRHITIIPEIEMPGHARAALAAYPELACTKGPFTTATSWGVFDDVFCPKEETFTFLENVLTEVMELFPSTFIHIGGDECPKTKWEESSFCQSLMKKENIKDEHGLQSYFIQRIEKFLNSKGRQIIGWDEILEGGLAPNATVMSWRGVAGGIEAATQGHKVVMTPTDYCYFDYYQSKQKTEPLAIGGYLPLSKVYAFEPIPEKLEAKYHPYVTGAQANVWTEYITTPEQVEYMVLPRMQAMAEVTWTKAKNKNYDAFLRRLRPHFNWWKKLGLKYADKTRELRYEIKSGDGNGVRLELKTNGAEAEIRYSENSALQAQSKVYASPIEIKNNTVVTAAVFENGNLSSPIDTLSFKLHLAAGKKITLRSDPASKYSANGNGSLINGVVADSLDFSSEWLGFEGGDLEAVIDLGAPTVVDNVDLRFFNSPDQWIYPPSSVSVFLSQNGVDFNEMPAFVIQPTNKKTISYPLPTAKTKTRFIKVIARNFGKIPKGKPGEGNGAWLFADEIIIE